MADRLESYARWLVANEDKKGTPEFETVATAYKQLRATGASAPTDTGPDTSYTGALQFGLDQPTEQLGDLAGLLGHSQYEQDLRGLVGEPTNYDPASPKFSDAISGIVGGDVSRQNVLDAAGYFPRAAVETAGQFGGHLLPRLGGAAAGVFLGGRIAGKPGAVSGAALGGFAAPTVLGGAQVLADVVRQHAANNGRTEPTREDWEAGLVTATASGALDAIAPGMAGFFKKVLAEGATEGFQALVEQAGASLGTDAGLQLDPGAAVAEGLLGAGGAGVVSGPGATLRTGSQLIDAAAARRAGGGTLGNLQIDPTDLMNPRGSMGDAGVNPMGAPAADQLAELVTTAPREAAQALRERLDPTLGAADEEAVRLTRRVGEESARAAEDPAQSASDVRVGLLLQGRIGAQQNVNKLDPGDLSHAFKGVMEDLKRDLGLLAQALRNAGDVDNAGFRALTNAVTFAAKHNRRTGEGGLDLNYLDTELDKIRALDLDPDTQRIFLNALRDLSTATYNSLAKRAMGPLERAARSQIGKTILTGLGTAAGGTVFGPLGFPAGAAAGMATSALAARAARKLDATLGNQQPPLMERLPYAQAALQASNIDPGDTAATIRQALLAAQARRRTVAPPRRRGPVDPNDPSIPLERHLSETGAPRGGGWLATTVSELRSRGLNATQENVLQAIRDLGDEQLLDAETAQQLLQQTGGRITNERLFYTLQDAVAQRLERSTIQPPRGAPRGPDTMGAPMATPPIRNPQAYRQTMDNVKSATDNARATAPSRAMLAVVDAVADARSLGAKELLLSGALRSNPEHTAWLEQHVRPLTKFGPKGDTGASTTHADLRARETAQDIAEQLAGRKLKPAQQAPKLTETQRQLQRRIARAFEDMPVNDLDNPRVLRAYNELVDEVTRQYDAMPITVELASPDQEPYANSNAMRDDVVKNGHLFVFPTTPETFGPAGADYTGHPLLRDTGRVDVNGKPLLANDLLRAAHDYYAHTMSPAMFGPLGEEAAWRNHMMMTKSPWARWALTSETRGQNSWVNFHPGAEELPVKDRPFSEQKAALLPLEFVLTGDADTDADVQFLAAEVGDHTVPHDDFDIPFSGPGHHRIGTRLPWGKKNADDQMAVASPDVATMRRNPKLMQKAANLVRGYVGFKTRARNPESVVRDFQKHLVENLLWLFDQVPPEIRTRSRLWYVGANRIAKEYAKEFSTSPQAAAGVISAMSPQKDWFTNVSLARRVLSVDSMARAKNAKADPHMRRVAQQIYTKPEYSDDVDTILSTPYNQLPTEYLKAMWVRLYDETHNDRSFQTVSPEGDLVGDAYGVAVWGSLAEIGKALRILRDPRPGNIHRIMGQKHKVRSFYNNIIDPNNADDVTVDTHAVSAALLRPLASTDAEVVHNFAGPSDAATGSRGLYPIYADAYREAALARGVLPREMQSITWEAVRGLFEATYKAKSANRDAVDAIWASTNNSEASRNAARERIKEHAKGITPPDWYSGPDSGAPAAQEAPGDARKLPDLRVPERTTAAVDGGARGRASAGAAEADLSPRKPTRRVIKRFKRPEEAQQYIQRVQESVRNGNPVRHLVTGEHLTSRNYELEETGRPDLPYALSQAIQGPREALYDYPQLPGVDSEGQPVNTRILVGEPALNAYKRGAHVPEGGIDHTGHRFISTDEAVMMAHAIASDVLTHTDMDGAAGTFDYNTFVLTTHSQFRKGANITKVLNDAIRTLRHEVGHGVDAWTSLFVFFSNTLKDLGFEGMRIDNRDPKRGPVEVWNEGSSTNEDDLPRVVRDSIELYLRRYDGTTVRFNADTVKGHKGLEDAFDLMVELATLSMVAPNRGAMWQGEAGINASFPNQSTTWMLNYRSSPQELAADAIQVIMQEPSLAKKFAPRTYKALKERVNKHPLISPLMSLYSTAAPVVALGAAEAFGAGDDDDEEKAPMQEALVA